MNGKSLNNNADRADPRLMESVQLLGSDQSLSSDPEILFHAAPPPVSTAVQTRRKIFTKRSVQQALSRPALGILTRPTRPAQEVETGGRRGPRRGPQLPAVPRGPGLRGPRRAAGLPLGPGPGRSRPPRLGRLFSAPAGGPTPTPPHRSLID